MFHFKTYVKMKNNEKQWSSAEPGLLLILNDRSGSMLSPCDGGDSRTVVATKAINRLINTLIQKNHDGKRAKDRCYVAVIGYDGEASVQCSGFLSELEEKPLHIEEVQKKISDGAGGLVEVGTKMPVWVEPVREDNVTNMMAAFRMCKELIEKWIKDHPDGPAPVIINNSDGMPYDGFSIMKTCMDETIRIVGEIKAIDTADGPVQIFNAMIGDGPRVVFPESRAALASDEARFLFDISTEIPESYRAAAEKNELRFETGARGAIYNADAELLIKLIDFGSSKGQSDHNQ